MLVFPNAKINIGLHVIEKRPDNFHNIESIFYPIQLHDSLEILEKSGQGEILFSSHGLAIPSSKTGNLCIQVYDLLNEKFKLPSIDCQLLKSIPIGAGLGGGSSDASFMLKALNKYFELNLSVTEMKGMIQSIGSDCPFFIDNKPAFVSGVGEQIEEIELNLKGFEILLVQADIHISTQEAYGGIKLKSPSFNLRQIQNLEMKDWKNELRNDFEDSIFPIHPSIKDIKSKLYSMGSVYSSMSGSGSSVYGIFKPSTIPKKIEFNNCFTWKGEL